MHKMLVVDDETDIVDILVKFFEKKGFEVISALEGERAMDIIRSRPGIDVMILDMKMPGMKGVDIVKAMKDSNIEIPVLFLSGSISLAEYLKDLTPLGYGKDDILLKPIDLNEVLKKVNEKLGNKGVTDEKNTDHRG